MHSLDDGKYPIIFSYTSTLANLVVQGLEKTMVELYAVKLSWGKLETKDDKGLFYILYVTQYY